ALRDGVIPAIAAEGDGRLRGRTGAARGHGDRHHGGTTGRGGRAGPGDRSRARTSARPGTPCGTRTRTATTAAARRATGATERQPSDVAPADRRVPVGLDLTGFGVGGDAV